MKKQEVPIVVADFLIEISAIIKEFNSISEFKLVVKSSEDCLLKIYPLGYESLFFKIDSFILNEKFTNSKIFAETYHIEINRDSHKLMNAKKPYVMSDINRFDIIKTKIPNEVVKEYLLTYTETIKELYSKIIQYEKTTLNLSNLFEIEEQEDLIPEPNHYETPDKILPYSLKQLQIKDFQGVIETGIDEIPVDSQWIFLVGENGFGKTTLLQAIFLGLHGALDDSTNLLEDKNSSIQTEYKSLENSVINSARDNKNPLVHLAAYGPGRLNVQGVKSENAEDRNNSISYNLFNSDGFLFNINSELRNLKLKKDKRFDLLKRAICTLIPNLADIKFNQETDQIEYIERELNADGESITYKPLPFKKLASGFKSIIALAGDMIVRLSKNQPEIKDPSELKGIVIIDEIDLHLHPKLQKQLIGQFSKVFPKIQFIVSTHSPIPLLGAESNTVILKINRTEADGIKIEKVDIDLKNLTPNLVLTSGIFDMEDFISVQNKNIDDVRTEDSMTEMEENDKVAKYLEEFEKSDEHFPDELFIPKTTK